MDVYALAISLLQVVTGCSPFTAAGANRHMKMAMIKEANAIAWAMRDATSEARLIAVSQELFNASAVDLKSLLTLGLRKNPRERLSAEQWSRLW
jgi:hypothetical protein